MVGFYATPDEKAALEEAAEERDITVAELLRRIPKILSGEIDDAKAEE
jgi:hypothetical protein